MRGSMRSGAAFEEQRQMMKDLAHRVTLLQQDRRRDAPPQAVAAQAGAAPQPETSLPSATASTSPHPLPTADGDGAADAVAVPERPARGALGRPRSARGGAWNRGEEGAAAGRRRQDRRGPRRDLSNFEGVFPTDAAGSAREPLLRASLQGPKSTRSIGRRRHRRRTGPATGRRWRCCCDRRRRRSCDNLRRARCQWCGDGGGVALAPRSGAAARARRPGPGGSRPAPSEAYRAAPHRAEVALKQPRRAEGRMRWERRRAGEGSEGGRSEGERRKTGERRRRTGEGRALRRR